MNYGTDSQRRLVQATVQEALGHVAPTKSQLGSGGASSKLLAAQLALAAGVEVYIAHAGHEASIEDTLSGKVGTKIVQ